MEDAQKKEEDDDPVDEEQGWSHDAALLPRWLPAGFCVYFFDCGLVFCSSVCVALPKNSVCVSANTPTIGYGWYLCAMPQNHRNTYKPTRLVSLPSDITFDNWRMFSRQSRNVVHRLCCVSNQQHGGSLVPSHRHGSVFLVSIIPPQLCGFHVSRAMQ